MSQDAGLGNVVWVVYLSTMGGFLASYAPLRAFFKEDHRSDYGDLRDRL